MILYCAADLLWATRIKGAADALGFPCRPVRNPEMLRQRLADSPVRSLIVDLEAEHGLEVIRALRQEDRTRAVRVVAFGPHVAVEVLETAKAIGADAVMARGAFSARLPQILTQLANQPERVEDDLAE